MYYALSAVTFLDTTRHQPGTIEQESRCNSAFHSESVVLYKSAQKHHAAQ
jgi:hypothetical protein